MPSDASTTIFAFDSLEGRRLSRDLSHHDLKYDPHDYSLDVAVKIIDGTDCLVRTACGLGKTGIIALLAIVLRKIGQDQTLFPGKPVQEVIRNPVILVICPTNALEQDLVRIHFSQFHI